jgi:hypothetical protein
VCRGCQRERAREIEVVRFDLGDCEIEYGIATEAELAEPEEE